MITDISRIADIIDRNSSLYMRHTPKREMVNLNDLIREMMILLQNKAQRHLTRVRSDLDAALAAVPADRVQIQQVILNLMLNGIEVMKDRKGELTVASKNPGNAEILVTVADSGIGLPAEKQNPSSTRSSPAKHRAQGWDFPSADESSNPMVAAYGRPPTPARARHFISPCPLRPPPLWEISFSRESGG
jgi:signal transduction histidine kinase